MIRIPVLFLGLVLGGFASGVLGLQASAGKLPLQPTSVPLSFALTTYADNTVSGGPRRDGIPSIDEPRFIRANEADRFLRSDDVVLGVARNGEVKAYPQRIMVWHEIVNDRVGGENVSVTYCPLTGTAIGFLRGDTPFGVTGMLVNNNLIMYDRASESHWPQILATAISGPLKGHSLVEFPVVWTTWSRWKTLRPETWVLSTDTGFARNYRRDPYGSYNPLAGYYRLDRPPLFPVLASEDRFQPKEVVIGARSASAAIAFKKDTLRAQKLATQEIAGTPYLAVYDPQLDSAYVYRNPSGRTFGYEDGWVVDATGKWKADGLPLERLNAFDAMWFAWAGFFPKTVVHDGPNP